VAEIFREQRSQSERDRLHVEALAEYAENSTASVFNKFDNFSKYVQQSTISRFLMRYEVFKKQLDIHGSIIELGVGRGASLMTWAHLSTMLEPVNYTREIIGFDTFTGVPQMSPEDESPHTSLARQGGFSVEDDAYEDLKRAIEIFDDARPLGHLEKIKLVKGDITETLPSFVNENPHLVVSLLHIDVDLYAAAKTGLELLFERIPKGGVILFDELNTKFYPGETLALEETLRIGELKLQRFPWSTTASYAIKE